MASNSDTLNIGSLRQGNAYPHAGRPNPSPAARRQADPILHPDAAAAARARIAALPETHPLARTEPVPTTPTADLIIDRQALARRAEAAPSVAGRQLPSAVKPMLTAVGIFAIVLLLFKSPIILSQLRYSLGSKPATPAASLAPAGDIIPAENTITIPKINVHAPVQYESSIQEAAIQKALESGVVHYGNTASPGQAGNVAIFGHSSNDWWEPGNFKFVFVLLDKLSPGDRLTIDYQSRRYTYEVTGSRVVDPTEVSVLNPTSTPTLTLITCSPPGTSLRRLVVSAKQVDPDPAAATAVVTAPASSGQANLPSSAPGFLDQIGQAWNGITHGFKSLFGGDNAAPQASPQPNSTSGSQLPTVK